MIKNHLKIAFRNLWKHRMFSMVNVFGLAVGLTVAIIILLFVSSELAYDDFHQNGDTVYRVLRKADLNDSNYLIGVTSGPFGEALKNDYPETVQDFTRVLPTDGLVTYADKSFNEEKFFLVDENFFDFFTYPLASGNASAALTNPNNIVLSSEMARKYFGEKNPLGETLRLDNQFDFIVTGVLAEKPGRSHLDFDFLASIKLMDNFSWFSNWWSNSLYTYVRINTPQEAAGLDAQLSGFMDKYFAEDFKRNGTRVDLTLQPLSEVYFQNEVRYDRVLHGDKNAVYIFMAIAVFIMLIACINYTNLTTARAGQRAREIGVRKALGAGRSRLVLQFLSESFLMTFSAILISLAAVELLLPLFNSTFQLDLVFPIGSLSVLGLLAALLVLVSIVAGSYPAFLLSSFRPVAVLNQQKTRAGSVAIRKGLVVFQFTISVVLIIATLLIGKQLNFLNDKDLGFDDQQVVLVRMNNNAIFNQREDFLNRLRSEPGIIEASAMTGEPGGFHDAMSFDIDGMDQNYRFRTVFTDYTYADVFDLELVAGRNFSRDFGTDANEAVMLNETAVRTIGRDNESAIGLTLTNTMMDTTQRRVVGVVKDYHFSSLKDEIEPLIIINHSRTRTLAIKVAAENIDSQLSTIRKHWEVISPSYPFEYKFLDESFSMLYQQEQKESTLLNIFAAISIIIACLGVFALAAFTAEERTKEIGIRKVLGASTGGIISLLSSDFIKLVLIGNLVAWPLAYFGMEKWLENFAYRTEISLDVFIAAGVGALLVTLLTIIWQAVRAALANPVDALRHE